jgi:hypothetical protein
MAIHRLADLQLARGADRDRAQQVARRLDAQHRQVLLGGPAEHLGIPLRLVGEAHADALAASDPGHHVVVGDHVPLAVPQEPGAGAARHLVDAAVEQVAPLADGGDVGDRGGSLAEQLDGVPLRVQEPGVGNRSRLGRGLQTRLRRGLERGAVAALPPGQPEQEGEDQGRDEQEEPRRPRQPGSGGVYGLELVHRIDLLGLPAGGRPPPRGTLSLVARL